MYTKFIIDRRRREHPEWREVIWALTTRVDPKRATHSSSSSTPIDYLISPAAWRVWAASAGIDATHKWSGETQRRRADDHHGRAAVSRRASTD
jgi:4-hydroxy-3-polyprenylbenzoate decarboxylase